MFPRHAFQKIARNVRLSPRAVTTTTNIRTLSMYTPLKIDAIHPDKIFDEIDVSGTGTISREEFKAALSRLRQQDLWKLHEAAAANLQAIDHKLDKLETIEKDLDQLHSISSKKQEVYNNIGMTTAANLDYLFDEAKMTRKRVQSNVSELKDALEHARGAYHNIGLTTAADLAALFPEGDKKAA